MTRLRASRQDPRHLRTSGQRRAWILLAASFISVGLLVIALAQVPAFREWFALSTSHRPEQFTSLYFRDYDSIPKHVVVGTSVSIPFDVTSHESQAKEYRYVASVQVLPSDQRTILATKSFSLEPGQTGSFEVLFSPTESGVTYRVEFRLLDLNQAIDVGLKS